MNNKLTSVRSGTKGRFPTSRDPGAKGRSDRPGAKPCGIHPLLLTSQRRPQKHPSPTPQIAMARRQAFLNDEFRILNSELPLMRTLQSISILLASALILLGSVTGCHRAKESSESFSQPIASPISVTTTSIQVSSMPSMTAHLGSVQTAQRAMVVSRLNANIQKVAVKIGQPVRSGDLLVQLDDRELKAAVDQAKAELERARSDWERYQTLLAERSVTQREADQVRTTFENAQANLNASTVRLGHASVQAPFDGIIEQIKVEAGEGVGMGQPLLSIETPGNLEIITHLPIHPSSEMNVGTSLKYTTSNNGSEWKGVITELATAANPQTRTIETILQPTSSENLKPGDVVRVWLPSAAEQSIWIPASSVLQKGQLEFVYLVHDSKASMHLVKSAKQRTSEQLTQIISGLKEGDVLVTSPVEGLTDGHPVVVQ